MDKAVDIWRSCDKLCGVDREHFSTAIWEDVDLVNRAIEDPSVAERNRERTPYAQLGISGAERGRRRRVERLIDYGVGVSWHIGWQEVSRPRWQCCRRESGPEQETKRTPRYAEVRALAESIIRVRFAAPLAHEAMILHQVKEIRG